VAQEQAVALEINREDFREAGRGLEPVEESCRRRRDEVALAAEADPSAINRLAATKGSVCVRSSSPKAMNW